MKPAEFFGTFVKHLRPAKAEQLFSNSDVFETVATTNAEFTEDRDQANLITSRYQGEGIETHALLIDLDVPHVYVPSTTEGHGHLYVDVKLHRGEWERVMRDLERVGVIGRGYLTASLKRGYASLRPPWIKKENI